MHRFALIQVCSDGARPGDEIGSEQHTSQQIGDRATTSSMWVFREFEVDVQPEPPPTAATQDQRLTEETLLERATGCLGSAGANTQLLCFKFLRVF